MKIPQTATPSADLFNLANDAGRLVAASVALVSEGQGGKLAAIAAGVNGDLAHQPIEALLFDACRQVATEKGDEANVADLIAAATAAATADGGEWQGSPAQQRLYDAVFYLRHLVGTDLEREAKLFAGRLAEERAKREAKSLLRSSLDDLESGCGTQMLACLAEKLAAASSSGGTSNDFVSLSEATDDFIEGRVPPAVPTNMTSFDSICGGLPRAVTILNGPPGSGKTALALQLTVGALLKNPDATALWCLGELRPHEFNQRAAALLGQIAGRSLQDKLIAAGGCPLGVRDLREDYAKLSEEAKATLRFTANWLDQRLKVWDPSDFSIEGVEAAAMTCKPDIVVIDYLQILSGGNGEGVERADDISMRVKNLAKHHDIAIIGVSSMAKSTNASTGSAADSSRKSAQFGFDAELSFVGQPPPEEDRKSGTYIVEWICKKARNGTFTDLALQFDGEYQHFGDGSFVGDF